MTTEIVHLVSKKYTDKDGKSFYVGTCPEYDGVILWGETVKEMETLLPGYVKSHKRAIKKYGIANASPDISKVVILDDKCEEKESAERWKIPQDQTVAEFVQECIGKERKYMTDKVDSLGEEQTRINHDFNKRIKKLSKRLDSLEDAECGRNTGMLTNVEADIYKKLNDLRYEVTSESWEDLEKNVGQHSIKNRIDNIERELE